LTQRLRSAADVLDIRVHDYVIVGDHCYYSFLEAEAKAEVLFGH
jgi:DNA repair protein RadC